MATAVCLLYCVLCVIMHVVCVHGVWGVELCCTPIQDGLV